MSAEPQHQMATEAIHPGEIRDPSRAHVAPIYRTSTFAFDGVLTVEK